MKRKKGASLLLILAAVFLAAGAGMLYSDRQEGQKAKREYESLAEMAVRTKEPFEQGAEGAQEEAKTYVSPIRFDELKKINPEVVGWIKIEGTAINYPIVQTADNETYLHKDFEGRENSAGAIYLDFESESDFSGKHNIIYGHHRKDGSMFKDLIKYKDEAFFREHDKIVVYTPEKEYHLTPMAALYTDASGIRRKTSFQSEESFEAYVEEMTKDCSFRQLPSRQVKRLWSFVTCSYEFQDARTIVYAYENP